MKHVFRVRIGPIGFRIGSHWREPIKALQHLYRDYPAPYEGITDFTVRIEAASPWRRFLRPALAISGDYYLPDSLPMALRHGLLAAEMGMNLQMALGQRRFLLLHASSVERDGQCLLMTGESGAGKSTLAALLGEHGWRLMGDEFALIDPLTGLAWPFPRAVSLKNEAISLFEARDSTRLGPVMTDTVKGTIRHWIPDAQAIQQMEQPARPALILFPRFGEEKAIRPVSQAEAFVRLTQASTNYVYLAEPGYTALTGLVTQCPSLAIDYADTQTALDLVEQLWAEQHG